MSLDNDESVQKPELSLDPLAHPKMFSDDEGNLFLNFGDYGNTIEIACFSGDGRTLLTVKEVGVATIWDVASGRRIGEIRPSSPLVGQVGAGPHAGPFQMFIESAALNGDGSLALLGLNDGTAGIFSTLDGQRLSSFHPPQVPPAERWTVIRAVNFSPDYSLALVGFPQRSVGVWRTEDYRLAQFLTAPRPQRLFRQPFARDTYVSTVAASQDNEYVFAGFADMTAMLWRRSSGVVTFEASHHVANILGLWVAPSQVRWTTTSGEVWDAWEDGRARRVLETGQTWDVAALSPDGESAVVRTIDGTLARWSTNGQCEELGKIETFMPNDAKHVIFYQSHRRSIFCDGPSSIRILTSERAHHIKAPTDIENMRLSPRGDTLVTTLRWTSSVILWDAATGDRLRTFKAAGGAWNPTFSHDQRFLAVGTLGSGGPGEIRPIYVWDLERGDLWCELQGHVHQVHALAFDPKGQQLISASLDCTVRWWRLDQSHPEEIRRLEYDDLDFHNLKVLADGRVIVFRSGSLEIWRGVDKLTTISTPYEYDTRWTVTEDESCILGTFSHQIVRKWSLTTGEESAVYRADIPRPETVPSRARLSGASSRFRPVAGGFLWRTHAGTFIHIGDGPRGWATPLTLSAKGQFLVLPGMSSAGLLDVSAGERLLSLLPFAGRLRATALLRNEIRLLNSEGRLFSQPMSDPLWP